MKAAYAILSLAVATLLAGCAASQPGSTGAVDQSRKPDLEGSIVNPENGHAYKRYDTPMSWHAARDLCASNGGHLATITSAAEHEFILRNFASDHVCWLGATEEGHEGKWTWVTGEPFEYTNWASGEPNDYVPNEDYMVMGRSEQTFYSFRQWNDHTEDGLFANQVITYPLCEWEK